MNRTTFLKALGVTMVAPGAVMGAVKAVLPKIPVLPSTIPLWSQHLFDYALKNMYLPTVLVGDQWAPPLKGPDKPLVINRIRPK